MSRDGREAGEGEINHEPGHETKIQQGSTSSLATSRPSRNPIRFSEDEDEAYEDEDDVEQLSTNPIIHQSNSPMILPILSFCQKIRVSSVFNPWPKIRGRGRGRDGYGPASRIRALGVTSGFPGFFGAVLE